jgi:Uma2 family endonuclease
MKNAIPVQIPVRQIQVPPGQRVLLQGLSWDDFEAILTEMGNVRAAQVAYCDGILEIMTPLPELTHPPIEVDRVMHWFIEIS